MVETPQSESRSIEIIDTINALFPAVVMSRIRHMRMLSRKMSCHIGTKHVAVTLEVVAQCMRS
jgi:hypothetical protein